MAVAGMIGDEVKAVIEGQLAEADKNSLRWLVYQKPTW